MEKMGNIVRLSLLTLVWFQRLGTTVTHSRSNISCEHEAMTDFLHDLAANYSNIANLVSIGKTEQNRDIWVMIVSDSPYSRPLLRPQVKYVGNINGVSGPACYVLLRLIQQLLEEYDNEASMERKLMESMEMHILPNINPDGYAKAVPGSCSGNEGRLNANNMNLNENFPDIFNENVNELPAMQKETEAMIQWIQTNSFTISVSLFSGAKVVVYPFDSIIVDEFYKHGEPHFTPDDDIFKHLSLTYAGRTGAPEQGWNCPIVRRSFPDGIINGAEWNPQPGTMMDFNYVQGIFEIMVGISCCRNDNDEPTLNDLWWSNREGLLHVVHEVGGGIRGEILDSETYVGIRGARLSRKLFGYDEQTDIFGMPWFTSSKGEFWRPWRPGLYRLRIEVDGYKMQEVDVEVKPEKPTLLRIEMERNEAPARIQPTLPNRIEKPHKLTTKSVEFVYEKTSERPLASTQSSSPELTPWTKSVDKELQSDIKHYASLTQVDHSFINLLRGLHLQNAGNNLKLNYFCAIVAALVVLIVRC